MAADRITYEDKEDIIIRPVAAKYKATMVEFNEIKAVSINHAEILDEHTEALGGVNIVHFSDVGGETIDLDNTTYNTIYISASSFESSLRLNVGCIGVGQVVVLTPNPISGSSNIYFNGTEARNENYLFSNNTLLVEQGKTVSILCLNATQFLIIGKVTNI